MLCVFHVSSRLIRRLTVWKRMSIAPAQTRRLVPGQPDLSCRNHQPGTCVCERGGGPVHTCQCVDVCTRVCVCGCLGRECVSVWHLLKSCSFSTFLDLTLASHDLASHCRSDLAFLVSVFPLFVTTFGFPSLTVCVCVCVCA